jgi:hypothetical protein
MWAVVERIAERICRPLAAEGSQLRIARRPLPDGGMELRVWPPNPGGVSVGFFVGHDGLVALALGEHVVEDFNRSRRQDLADYARELESWVRAAVSGNYCEQLSMQPNPDGGEIVTRVEGWLTVDGEKLRLRGWAPKTSRRVRGRSRPVVRRYEAWGRASAPERDETAE